MSQIVRFRFSIDIAGVLGVHICQHARMASERTPLLEQGVTRPEAVLPLPSLRRALESLSAHQPITTKDLRDVVPDEATPSSGTHLYAFFFAVSLYAELSNPTAPIGMSQSHMSLAPDARGLVEELWTSYSEWRLGNTVSPRISSDLDVRELLWMPILSEDEGDDGPEFTSGEPSTAGMRGAMYSNVHQWQSFWPLFPQPPFFSSSLVYHMPSNCHGNMDLLTHSQHRPSPT